MHSAKKAFSLLYIYICTFFHYFIFSWGYCKFYMVFQWNVFSRPLGVGEGCKWGQRPPSPMKLGWNKDGKPKCHISRSILLTFCHLLQSSFTFWKRCVWGQWNVYIASWRLFQIAHIYMHKAVKGLKMKPRGFQRKKAENRIRKLLYYCLIFYWDNNAVL